MLLEAELDGPRSIVAILLGRGETLISRQHGLAGLEEFNHNEGGKHNNRKYGSESHVVGGRGEARQAQATVGLAILNQGHLERVIGECWRAKGASAGSTLATFVAPLGEITDGRKVEAVQELVEGNVFFVTIEMEDPELLVGAVLELGAEVSLALIIVAKLEGEGRAVVREAVEIRITSVKTSDVEQRDVGLVADFLKNESERIRCHREAFE